MKKKALLALLVLAFLTSCTPNEITQIRKDRPWIPATTRVAPQGQQKVLVDFVDYAFTDDPAVLGTWWSVDFVEDKKAFTPGIKSYPEDLYLKKLEFKPNGVMGGDVPWKWTKGHVLTAGGMATDSAYELMQSAGKTYLFYQWKSGDYSLRYDKPSYYVLVKSDTPPAGQTAASTEPAPGDEANYRDLLSARGKLEIVRHPAAADFTMFPGHGKLGSLPSYDPKSGQMWQVDLRSSDLSGLDLGKRLADLRWADFDNVTKWPARLPRGFDPVKFMELGRNPGLGVRGLHARGITGAGVGIAIIDQSLLVDHDEYKDRLRLYEEIHWSKDDTPAAMHAPAVASIAAGKSVGVAPGADLYFIANWMGNATVGGSFVYELSSMARSIDRIIEVNAGLPAGRRIRVISISLGINPSMKGYPLVKEAMARAAAAAIYVAHVGSDPFLGGGRDPMKDPDAASSHGPGEFWRDNTTAANGQILIPMDSRCTASPTGPHDYVFYREGGMSWTVPWVAGLYALACQKRPDMTPQAFWEAAAKTAVESQAVKVIDPVKLLESLGG
jgi:hypothetical protein